MAVSKWSVVQNGLVTNVIMWDGDPQTWTPPAGATVVAYDSTLPVAPPSIEQQNQTTLQTQASTALLNNRTYLALNNPTTAQSTAQVRALTQQINGVIRLLLQQFDATN